MNPLKRWFAPNIFPDKNKLLSIVAQDYYMHKMYISNVLDFEVLFKIITAT
jgi:hypothetical protein